MKVAGRLTPSGSRIEYYFTSVGPPLEQLMEPIYRLAMDSIYAKISQTPTASKSSVKADLLSPIAKGRDSQ